MMHQIDLSKRFDLQFGRYSLLLVVVLSDDFFFD
jgi:hypothetical protein